jgi:hypothetical protein
MKRTGSIGSRVPPAVTRTRRPSQGPGSAGGSCATVSSPTGAGRSASASVASVSAGNSSLAGSAGSGGAVQLSPPISAASTRASSSSGSGRRPRPCSPREARRPSPGSITSTPRSRSVARLAWVAASAYIRSFIAGARSRGASQARKEVASIESAKPPASLAIVLAEAGATMKASQFEASSRWPIGSWKPVSVSSPGKAPRIGSRSNSEVRTGAPTIPSNEAAPTKRSAFSVIRTRTPWPASVARRANSSDLYAAIPPLTPSNNRAIFELLGAGRYAPSCGTRI